MCIDADVVRATPTLGIELQGRLDDVGVRWDGRQIELQQSGFILLVADPERGVLAVGLVCCVPLDVGIHASAVAVFTLLQNNLDFILCFSGWLCEVDRRAGSERRRHAGKHEQHGQKGQGHGRGALHAPNSG